MFKASAVTASVTDACPSVTLVHLAEAVGLKLNALFMHTCAASNDIVLDKGHSPHMQREIWVSEPLVRICNLQPS